MLSRCGECAVEPVREARQRPGCLQPFYERAYDNRREADSDGMGALLKLARTVKASDDAGLISRFQPLLDWVKAHHGGPRGGFPAGGGGGSPPGGGK